MSAAQTLPEGDAKELQSISLFVNNKPGVLMRVALVFSRRGFNIESLVVSPAREGRYARMTITCSGRPEDLGQIINQLAKLVDVVRAVDHTDDKSYESEIALVKVSYTLDERTQILQLVEHYRQQGSAQGWEISPTFLSDDTAVFAWTDSDENNRLRKSVLTLLPAGDGRWLVSETFVSLAE